MELLGFYVDEVSLSTNFQRPLAAKLCIRPQKCSSCKNALEVLYHHVKFGGAWISPSTGMAKKVEFLPAK